LQGLAGNRRYFKLNWPVGLVLHDDGTRGDLVAMSYVSDLEGEKVAATKLAVNTEIKECWLPDTTCYLETDTQSPDVFHFEGGFLSNDLAFVPRFTVNGIA
jgi:hypothetical protein